jgi:NAD(P)-dependent dehydrogenase (short-subunit alcohol dehydrogenase family)
MTPSGASVAVVTGGASGIGLALAQRLATDGARVFLVDVHKDRLAAAQAELPGSLTFVADVGDPAAVDEAAATCLRELGPPSVVCANAGIAGATGNRLWELPTEAWETVLRVDLLGVVHTVRAFFPQLLATSRGKLLITASMAGVTVSPNMPAYFAAKHAVVSLAETLRLQARRDQLPVTVSLLLPSRVATNIGESHDEDFDISSVLPEASTEMNPADVARRALAAMDRGQFYVFTHPDSRARVDEWYAEVVAAYGDDEP